MDEVIAHMGPPSMRMGDLLTWQQQGFLSSYSVTLQFDRYGVCASIVNEIGI